MLIKVDSAPILPADLLVLSGSYAGITYPTTPGIEGSGVVVSDGPLKGKRVAFMSAHGHGSFAEYSVAEQYCLIEVANDVPL